MAASYLTATTTSNNKQSFTSIALCRACALGTTSTHWGFLPFTFLYTFHKACDHDIIKAPSLNFLFAHVTSFGPSTTSAASISFLSGHLFAY